MSSSSTKMVLLYAIIYSALSQYVTWTEIPSLRVGQVQSVQSLMTSEDTNPNITDQPVTFLNPMTGAATSDLKAGVSLMSYESWMTDTFSYNITVTNYDLTGLNIRFRVLAKVHYIVLWRTNSPDNGLSPKTYNLQILFGCYLTSSLLAGENTRNTTVGNLTTSIAKTPSVVVKSMIAGMQMSNSVGVNNYIQVTTGYSGGSNLIQHIVIVENNCFLQFVCVTTLILDQVVSDSFDIQIIQFSTTVLSGTNAGLSTVPYMERYDGISRMFFGFSKLNLSMADTRYLNVETANISLVSLLYDKNQAMNEVVYNMFFFAKRSCPNSTHQFYNPDTYDCNSSCPTEGYAVTGTPPNIFCMPCHYSCLTCGTGNSATACQSCNPNNSRIFASSACDCDTYFSDAGVAKCIACNSTLDACSTCSSPNVCTTCISNVIYTLIAGKCECALLPVRTYMASGYCLPYPGCLNATKFNNNISCDACDIGNYFIMKDNSTCDCQLGFQLNMSANPVVCYHNCPNGIAPNVSGMCDDGNTNSSDGCTNCTVDEGYYCTFQMLNPTTPAPSNCTLKTVVSITYLYAQRFVNSNHFIMAFSLSPTVAAMSSDIFVKNFLTSIPMSSSSITYDSSTQTIYVEGDYTQSIEGTGQTANVTFNSMPFYAEPIVVSFTCIGANAELVIESYNSTNKMLEYIIMGMGVYALLLAIFSAVVGLKMVGIELLVPVQLIYFSLATLPAQSTYSFILNNLKYANGYSTIKSYSYYRTASQSRNLVGMNYQTEFLLSINIMLVIYVMVLLWLMVHHFRLKYKEHKLEVFLEKHATVEDENRSNDSEEDKQNQDNDEEKVKLHRKRQNNEVQQQESKLRQDHHRSFKVFTFQVDRVYFIFYMILMNQMMFGFILMTLNVPITIFTYPQEINVLVCNFIFFIYIGNIVFISYDQESNKMINFTSISDRYAYVYFVLDFIIIIVLAMTFQLEFSLYLVCVISAVFLLLIIKERPYSSVLCTFENVVAMYLHAMLLISLILLCVMSSKTSNERQDLIYSYMIVAMIFIGQILTTIRVVMKVNFKKAFDDLKDPNDDDNLGKKANKVIEKDMDLLQRENRMEIIPPDSVRNGLLTPKDKVVDWESKNTDEYESLKRENQNHETKQGPDADNSNTGPLQEEEGSEIKDEKLNQLQILKKKLRNNLKLKQEASALSKKDK